MRLLSINIRWRTIQTEYVPHESRLFSVVRRDRLRQRFRRCFLLSPPKGVVTKRTQRIAHGTLAALSISRNAGPMPYQDVMCSTEEERRNG
jgi:hypothetical protein